MSKRIYEVFQEEKFNTFGARIGDWRWHALSRNGNLTSTSGENFASKANALRAARREASLLKPGFAEVRIKE